MQITLSPTTAEIKDKLRRYTEAQNRLAVFAESRLVYDFCTPEYFAAYKAAERRAYVSGIIDFLIEQL